MKEKNTIIYECEYCPKYYKRKDFAINHEKQCSNNPNNFRACHSCRNLTKKDTKIYTGVDDYYDGEPYNKDVSFLYCKKKEIFIYPTKSEAKNNFSHIDENGGTFDNHPMPKICNDIDFNGSIVGDYSYISDIDKVNIERHKHKFNQLN